MSDLLVAVKLHLTEHDRRRIRAGFIGRGGVATRKEIRVWADAIVKAALEGLPEPKASRKPVASDPTPARTRFDVRFAAASRAPDDARCRHCQKPKSDHGRAIFSCPPGSPSKGRWFESVEETP